MSYSIDLRERVIKFIEKGGSKAEAMRVFAIARYTIYNWLKKKAEKGSLEDEIPRRSWKKIDPAALIAYVEEHADFSLSDYAKHFNASIPAISKAFKRLKITRKKRLCSTKRGMKKSVPYFWSK